MFLFIISNTIVIIIIIIFLYRKYIKMVGFDVRARGGTRLENDHMIGPNMDLLKPTLTVQGRSDPYSALPRSFATLTVQKL